MLNRMLIIENQRDNVDLIRLDDKEIFLVGTAHISRKSAELVEELIAEIRPDAVAVELCESRYHALQDPERWKNTDIVSVIREGRAYVLIAQLMLAAFQRKLGQQLNIRPGAEMLAATAAADKAGIPVILADREIRTTLRRTLSAMGLWTRIKLFFSLLCSAASKDNITAEEIEKLKSGDALDTLIEDFSKALPEVQRTLINERDLYLAAKIKASSGKRVLAVVGAGHTPGIKRVIGDDIDIAPLEIIPPRRLSMKLLAWSIPALIVGLLLYGFLTAGAKTGVEMITAFVVINAALTGLGAAIAFAHPLTILATAVCSPFTSASPFIAAGWVAGLVEAVLRKPLVADFESVADDIATIKGIWRNRLSRILLIVVLTNLFGSAGTLLGWWAMAALVN
jgi:pheromone shutdown-related protein TraB